VGQRHAACLSVMIAFHNQAGEVIDSATISVGKLRSFYEETLDQAKKEGMMVSLHLKATMMKV